MTTHDHSAEGRGLTQHQRRLARHALGLPNDNRRSYRNRYIAVPGTREYEDWLEMTDVGNAVKTRGEEMGLGKCDHFSLRHKAALSALDVGEKLDPEDFPSGADFAEPSP
jgi:hypothetical protein